MGDGPEQVAAEKVARAQARRQTGSRFRADVGDPRVHAITERILQRADEEFAGPLLGRPSSLFRRGIWEAIRALVRALVAEHLETRMELIELRREVLELDTRMKERMNEAFATRSEVKEFRGEVRDELQDLCDFVGKDR